MLASLDTPTGLDDVVPELRVDLAAFFRGDVDARRLAGPLFVLTETGSIKLDATRGRELVSPVVPPAAYDSTFTWNQGRKWDVDGDRLIDPSGRFKQAYDCRPTVSTSTTPGLPGQ